MVTSTSTNSRASTSRVAIRVGTASGTATGIVNFINFSFSALLGPVFANLLVRAAAGAASPGLAHYQAAFSPMLAGVAAAVLLTLLLKETGPAVARPAAPILVEVAQ